MTRFSYKSLFIILFFLLIGIVALFKFYPQNKISAAWWNDGWGYRTRVDVTNSSGSDLSNQRIKITLNTSTLISTGKMQSDCDDIRVTSQSGKLLDHWVINCNSSSSSVYVKMEDLPSSGSNVFVYYGNPSVSNIENTLGSTNYPGTSCQMMRDQGSVTSDGLYYVTPGGNDDNKIQVYCDMTTDSSGWSLVLNHVSSSTPGPNPNWNQVVNNINTSGTYSSDLTSFSLFLGVKHWNYLGDYIRVEVGSSPTSITKRYDYTSFSLDTGNYYALTMSGETQITGTGSPGIYSYHNNRPLTTTDADHDASGSNCANSYNYAWWYGSCWNGSFWGSTVSHQDRAFWTGSTSDYHNYGGLWLKGDDSMENISTGTPATEEQSLAPIAYWKFDEGVGTTAYDSSSSALNGLISAATWQTEDQCMTGKCLYFNESTSYVSLGTNNTLTKNITNITISAWVKLGKDLGTVSDNYEIISNESYQNYGYLFRVENTTSTATAGKIHFRFSQAGASTNVTAQSNSFPNDHQWHYLVGTKNGTVGKIYLDGKEMTLSTNQSLSNPVDASGATQIGGISQRWNGFLDDVKVYPYARSATQIKQDYAAGKSHSSSTKGTSANLGSSNQNLSALTDGLIGYWKMDENVGTTTVDSSGNNNTATLGTGNSAPTWSPGKYGVGLSFNGTTNYIKVSYDASLKKPVSAITMGAWVKLNSTGGWQSVVQYPQQDGSHVSTYFDWAIYVGSGGGLHTRIDGESSGTYGTISWGEWTHVAIAWDGSSTLVKYYINGALVGTYDGTKTSIVYDNNNPVYFGQNAGGGEKLSGSLDEVRIYNRALSPSEVSQLYNWAPGPIGYWDFNENVGTTAYDKSGNNYSGSLGADNYSPTWDIGKYGSGLKFNGNQFVNLTRFANKGISVNLSNFTVSTFIKPTLINGNSKAIYVEGAGGSTGSSWAGIFLVNNEIRVHFKTYNTGDLILYDTVGANVTANNIYYITVTRTGNNFTTYVNGIIRGTGTHSGASWNSYPPGVSPSIGDHHYYSNSKFFSGIIDDVKIYNYPRNQRQIIEDMNAGHPIGGSPVGSQLAYWKMDEGYGSTTNNSGFGGSVLNGTFGTGNSAPTWTNNGKFNKALSFDGGDYTTISDNPALDIGYSGSISISVWYYSTTADTNTHTILAKRQTDSSTNTDYILFISNNYLTWGTGDSTDSVAWMSITEPSRNQWHQIVAVLSRDTSLTGTKYLYVDGNLVSSGTYATKANATSTPLYIGKYNGSGAFWEGLIDEVKIYNTALTAEDIKLDYNRGSAIVMGNLGTNSSGAVDASSNRSYCIPGDTSTCNPPVGEWKFEEGVGTTAYDTSGNNNNGIWQGTLGNQWSQGKIGKAGSFNGANNYILGTNNLGISGNAEFTMCAWMKWIGISWPSDYPSFMGNNSTGSTNNGLSFTVYQGRPAIDFWVNRWRASNALSLNTWYYVCGTKTAGTISTTSKIYVNGQLVSGAVEGTDTTPNITDSPPVIGRLDGTRWFQGLIDQAEYFNYARTPAQVAWDYNRGGPVGHWKFDECQGSIVYDSSGVGTTGGISIGTSGTQNSLGTCAVGTSAAWTNGASGKLNSSLSFDGIDDYINLGNNTNLNPQQHGWSTSFWVKSSQKTSQNGGYVRVMGRISGGAPYWILRTHTNNGDYAVMQMLDASSNSGGVSGTNTVTDGVWHHLVFVYDYNNSKSYIYLDGVRDGYNDWTGTSMGTVNPSLPLHIGQANANSEFFSGQIDDVRIYNYALTATQTKTLYNNGAVNFSN
ncbi:MAG: DUF2341 domain-containing protein [Candidatus Shapirobacteria bacterium]|nr:DUF2341 domain-containing protein [Candidatus Shapirobacteria bacterium]